MCLVRVLEQYSYGKEINLMMEVFADIVEKLKIDDTNASAYKTLGDYYAESNIDMAYLCYEHAAFYCSDSEEKEELNALMNKCREQESFSVVPSSIVILSYNSMQIMVECLDAIRDTLNKESYEVIVIDSSTENDVKDYLKEQSDIKLVMNSSFAGFAAGCNQGAKCAESKNDIFLLNNDAILAPHALFYLRMGLYSSEKVGASGPMGENIIIEQREPTTKEQWHETAKSISIPMNNALQKAHFLQGYALLVKRSVWDVIGGLDTRFGFGCYEDTDYGMRMNENGFHNVICHNSFVWHYGSQSMNSKKDEYVERYLKNQHLFDLKWNINWYSLWRTDYNSCNMIEREQDENLTILSVGCGLANVLNVLQYRYPNAKTYGIEKDINVANIAKSYQDVIVGDIESMELSFEDECFDYVLMTGVMEYINNPRKVLEKLKEKIKPGGALIIDVKNSLDIRRLVTLLGGRSSYTEGVVRYYTGDDLTIMLKNAGYSPEKWIFTYLSDNEIDSNAHELISALAQVNNIKDNKEYMKSGIMVFARKPV